MQLNKDFLIIFVAKLVQVAISVVTIKVSTMLLSPEEMGNIYIFLTVQTFFVLTFISPVGQYINRKTHTWSQNESIIDNLTIFLIFILLVTLFSTFIGCFLYYFFDVGSNFEADIFLLLLAGSILFVTLNQTYMPFLNMLHYRLEFTILSIFTSFFMLIFGSLFVELFKPSAEFWLYGVILSNLIFAIFGYILIRKRIGNVFHGFNRVIKKLNNYDYKSLLYIVIPISIATLFMWSQNSAYRIIIEQKISLEFLGYLGVGLSVASQLATVFESILIQYFSPVYFQRISQQNEIRDRIDTFNWLLNIKIPMYFLLALYVTVFAPYIVDILVDERYKDVYIYTMFGIWIEFFRMVTNVFYSASLSELKTQKVILPYILGGGVTLTLVYIFSEHSHYEFYLPIGLVLGSLATMILMYIYMKKVLDFKIDYRILSSSFLLSLMYCFIYLFDIEKTFLNSFLLTGGFGVYLLLLFYFIYKQKIVLGYSSHSFKKTEEVEY